MAVQKVQFILEAIDQASQEIKKVTQGLDGMGGQSKITKADVALAGAAISGSIVKIGVDAVQTFRGFEKTMSGVSAVLTPTKEEFGALSSLARDLGKSTTYSADQSAKMIEMLAKNGLNTKQILDGAAKSSIDLAAATGAELSQAADIASSAMTVFGKKVTDLDQVVNSITGTTNISKFGIEDYALAMAQGGGAASAFGVSLEDFNTSIAAISPLFQSGSDAGTSFKTFLQRLVPASDNAADAMTQLGLITKDGQNQFFDASGQMKSMADISGILQNATKNLSDEQKIASLSTIFGTDAMRAAAGMAKVSTDEFKKMSTAIEGTSAAENAKTRMQNLDGALEQLNGSVQELQIALGSMLAPAVQLVAEGLGWLADKASSVLTWIQQLPGPISTAIEIFGGLLIAGVALTGMFAFMTVTLGGVAAAMWAVLAPALPFIAIGAAIAAAMYLIYQAGKVVVDFLITAWNGNLGGVRDFTLGVWGAIKDAFGTAMDFIKSTAQVGLEALSFLWENKTAILKGAWDLFWSWVMAVLELTVQAITIAAVAFYQLFTGDWDGFLNTLSTTWTNVWNAVTTFATGAWTNLKVVGSALFGALGSYLSGLWDSIKTTFITKWTALKDGAIELWNGLVWFFKGEGSTTFTAAFNGMLSTVTSAAKSIFNGAIGMIESFINSAIEGINRLIRASNKVNPIWQIGEVSPVSIPRFAHGGVVEGPRGIDKVPAMLTAGEVVLNAAQQSNVATKLQGGGGVTYQITLSNNNFYGSAESFAADIGDSVLEIFKNHAAIQSF